MENKNRRRLTQEELDQRADDATRSSIVRDAQGNVIKGERLTHLLSENLPLEQWKKQFEDPNDPDIEIIDLGEV